MLDNLSCLNIQYSVTKIVSSKTVIRLFFFYSVKGFEGWKKWGYRPFLKVWQKLWNLAPEKCSHVRAQTHRYLVCHFRVLSDILPKRSEAPMLKTPAIKMRNILLKRASLAFNEIMTFTLKILFVDLTLWMQVLILS